MKKHLLLLSMLMVSSLAFSQAGDETGDGSLSPELIAEMLYFDSVEKAMVYDSGIVELPNGIAKLHLPKGFKYLNQEQAHFVLTTLWGNPSDQKTLGIIFPSESGVTMGNSWVFNILYEETGYVDDDDAEDIDYDELLVTMKEQAIEDSKIRAANGYEGYSVVGWAEKPFYDKDAHVLYWGQELKFDSGEESTLNYDFRILGRKGVLSLYAISGMDQLEAVSALKTEIPAIVKFNDGEAYTDFNPDIDKVAAITVGGLVAGKALAKIGFLAKFWKLISIGVIAAGSGIAAFFKRRKNDAVNTTNSAE